MEQYKIQQLNGSRENMHYVNLLNLVTKVKMERNQGSRNHDINRWTVIIEVFFHINYIWNSHHVVSEMLVLINSIYLCVTFIYALYQNFLFLEEMKNHEEENQLPIDIFKVFHVWDSLHQEVQAKVLSNSLTKCHTSETNKSITSASVN